MLSSFAVPSFDELDYYMQYSSCINHLYHPKLQRYLRLRMVKAPSVQMFSSFTILSSGECDYFMQYSRISFVALPKSDFRFDFLQSFLIFDAMCLQKCFLRCLSLLWRSVTELLSLEKVNTDVHN